MCDGHDTMSKWPVSCRSVRELRGSADVRCKHRHALGAFSAMLERYTGLTCLASHEIGQRVGRQSVTCEWGRGRRARMLRDPRLPSGSLFDGPMRAPRRPSQTQSLCSELHSLSEGERSSFWQMMVHMLRTLSRSIPDVYVCVRSPWPRGCGARAAVQAGDVRFLTKLIR